MKTLVEASSAYTVGAGIGRYARNVLDHLLREGTGHQWVLSHTRPDAGEPVYWHAPGGPNVREIPLPVTRRNADRLWHRLRIPLDLQLLAGRADVLYSPDFMAPPAARVPRMITVHDLAFMTHPEYTTAGLSRFLTDVVPRQIIAARKVAVVSESVKADLVNVLGVPEEKIVVARNGVNERFFGARPLDEVRRAALGLPARYFLMVGTIEPRKNHLNTLRAFERSGVGKDMPLVLAGRPGWAYEAALEKANELAGRGIVRLLDYVPEPDLPGLYAGAQAVLYPSITEGFGLPIIEAFATGSPVLTGTAPALKEVGGRHAAFADPLDIDELASRIRELADGDPSDLAARASRQAWAFTFSWPETGAIILETLTRLAES